MPTTVYILVTTDSVYSFYNSAKLTVSLNVRFLSGLNVSSPVYAMLKKQKYVPYLKQGSYSLQPSTLVK